MGKQTTVAGNWARSIGFTLSMLAVLFLVFDSAIKMLQMAPAIEATTQLGYPEHLVLWIGVLEIICLVVYVIPQTSALGAILLTGYLGGAIATQVRAGSPLFSVVFPVIVGLMVWGGLFLNDTRLRDLIPLRR